MTKPERIRKAKKICKLYETNEFTIESCCQKRKVPYDTFYLWINKYKEIKKLYKKTQNIKRKGNNTKLIRLARTALEKKLSFMEYEEVTTISRSADGITQIAETKIISKIVIPTATDIALALNNLDEDFSQNEDLSSEKLEATDFEYEIIENDKDKS